MLVTTKTSAVLVNCMVIDRAVYLVGTIALDDFLFAIAICTGQYASFDMISFIIP